MSDNLTNVQVVWNPMGNSNMLEMAATELSTRPMATWVTTTALSAALTPFISLSAAAFTLSTIIGQMAISILQIPEKLKNSPQERLELECVRGLIGVGVTILSHMYYASQLNFTAVAISSTLAYLVARAIYAAVAIFLLNAIPIA